jgi:hypothetical protein
MTSTSGAEVVAEGIAHSAASVPSRKGWRRIRIGMATRLTLVVIPLVLVPLGALAYVWYSSTKAAMELQVREELQVRLRQVALRLRPFLRERELDLYDLAGSPALRDYHTQLERVFKVDGAVRPLGQGLAQYLLGARGTGCDYDHFSTVLLFLAQGFFEGKGVRLVDFVRHVFANPGAGLVQFEGRIFLRHLFHAD